MSLRPKLCKGRGGGPAHEKTPRDVSREEKQMSLYLSLALEVPTETRPGAGAALPNSEFVAARIALL